MPQRRRRLILLGGLSSKIDFAIPAINRRTVQDAIGSMPPAGASGDLLHDLKEIRSEKILRRIKRIPQGNRILRITQPIKRRREKEPIMLLN